MQYGADRNIKRYFSISEVCEMTGLEKHVLRYWETEIPQLKPKKNRAGNRNYTEKDIQLVKYIQYLVHEELFTIQGASKQIQGLKESRLDKLLNAPSPARVKIADESEILGERAQQELVLDANPSGQDRVEKLKILRENLQEVLAILKKPA